MRVSTIPGNSVSEFTDGAMFPLVTLVRFVCPVAVFATTFLRQKRSSECVHRLISASACIPPIAFMEDLDEASET